MKRLLKYTLLFVWCLLSRETLRGEEVSPASMGVVVTSSELIRCQNQLQVKMELDLTQLKLGSNRSLELIPELQAGTHELLLPSMTINGRNKHILFLRSSDASEKGLEMGRKNHSTQTITYRQVVPFAEWMNESKLLLHLDLCGCGGKTAQQSTLRVNEMWMPQVAFLTPKAEAIKTRSVQGQAFLDFPVNETVIYADYRKNPDELEKIRQTIDLVRNDSNTIITHISIHGYASPEGTLANNGRLAEARSKALKDYVRRFYQFSDTILDVQSTPEDWKGLRSYVEASSLADKNQLMSLIDNVDDPDERESLIRKVGDGKPYQQLLRDCYPALRHSDYQVTYVVRGFTVEEGKKLLKTRPQQLSLQEMYLIAQTYEPGSDEFNEVFDVAVRMFPDDETANLNASAVALNQKNTEAAQKYLSKANPTSAITLNNQAVLATLEGQREEASQLFQQAAEAGNETAKINLQKIQ